MTEQKIDFTRRLIVLGNLALLGWIFSAFFSMLLYNFLYSWIYLVFLAFIIYAVLRRLSCRNCYTCKSCSSGFGRLAGAFFGKGFVKKESIGNRIGLIAFIYLLLFPVPAALLTVSLMNSLSVIKVLAAACLLTITAYSLTTWFNHSTTTKNLIWDNF